ncbi:hypothetical protein AMAG_18685 [Allomyces macrogynus ATCC 38327]|uniref:EF-hand domain-containing protein n=1 Tax=Allomyces macrogynus (strain ATCC 38327) TaxID=578462 RepID=A0A0L0SGZ4_ALLM3|nr:hypothetical protein AMAG_18685 [Allomyces macrogynus ATCC 38327]|eukprot:KNE61783.1 hypothetical protein AMAG_18685 [Allomyces macrogynus ATCC 38327]
MPLAPLLARQLAASARSALPCHARAATAVLAAARPAHFATRTHSTDTNSRPAGSDATSAPVTPNERIEPLASNVASDVQRSSTATPAANDGVTTSSAITPSSTPAGWDGRNPNSRARTPPPLPTPPRARRRKGASAPVWAAVCVLTIAVGVLSEQWWFRTSKHRHRVDGDPERGGGKSGVVFTEPAGDDPDWTARLAVLEKLQSLDDVVQHYAGADRETLTPRDAVRALVRVVPGSELPVDDDAQLVEELAAAVAGATRRDARLDARALDRVAHLLALPPARMRVAAAALDADGDGLLTLREFQAALAGGVPIESSAPPTGLLATWFGTDGKGTVRVADLAATLARARAALTRLQFTAHAVDAVMPLERYAWLVAAAATTAVGDVVEHARMVDRVDRVRGKWAHERGITMDDYVAFDALARHADRLVVAMRYVDAQAGAPGPVSVGRRAAEDAWASAVDQATFRRAARALDVTLSPTQVAVLFDLLDADGDGRLALAEFRTLARRFRHQGTLPPSVAGPCATAPVGPTPFSVRVRAWWRCALTGVPPADDDDSESIDNGTAALIIFTGGPAAMWNDATEVVAAE